VDDDQRPICGAANVELDPIGPGAVGRLEGGDGVLERSGPNATVGKYQRPTRTTLRTAFTTKNHRFRLREIMLATVRMRVYCDHAA